MAGDAASLTHWLSSALRPLPSSLPSCCFIHPYRIPPRLISCAWGCVWVWMRRWRSGRRVCMWLEVASLAWRGMVDGDTHHTSILTPPTAPAAPPPSPPPPLRLRHIIYKGKSASRLKMNGAKSLFYHAVFFSTLDNIVR